MPFLRDAVESILTQTIKNFRLLIIDDGSTDGTQAYLKTLSDPRIDVVRHDNQGTGASINHGIELTSTEFIARMDADDISHPDRFRLQLGFLEKHQDVVMLGTQVAFISGENQFSGPIKPLCGPPIKKLLMKGRAGMCHAACIFKTSAAKKIGGYRIKRAGQDIDFFLRMSEVGNLANLNEVLYLIRIHDRSINYSNIDEVILGKAYAVKCAKLRQEGAMEPTIRQFKKTWKNRNYFKKAIDFIDGFSTVIYRQSLIDIAKYKKFRGYLLLCFSAVLRPEGVIRRVSGRIRRLILSR